MEHPEIPKIGERMRNRRTALGMTLDELADRTGLSKGFLSQIERSLSSPSIDSLSLIASALSVPMFLFLVEDSHQQVVVHKDERRAIVVPDSRFRYESIWFRPDRKMEILMGHLKPGESSSDEPHRHSASTLVSVDECMLVLEGKAHLEIDSEVYTLEAGDCAYFNGTMPHRYINIGNEELVVFFVIAPPAMSR